MEIANCRKDAEKTVRLTNSSLQEELNHADATHRRRCLGVVIDQVVPRNGCCHTERLSSSVLSYSKAYEIMQRRCVDAAGAWP